MYHRLIMILALLLLNAHSVDIYLSNSATESDALELTLYPDYEANNVLGYLIDKAETVSIAITLLGELEIVYLRKKDLLKERPEDSRLTQRWSVE